MWSTYVLVAQKSEVSRGSGSKRIQTFYQSVFCYLQQRWSNPGPVSRARLYSLLSVKFSLWSDLLFVCLSGTQPSQNQFHPGFARSFYAPRRTIALRSCFLCHVHAEHVSIVWKQFLDKCVGTHDELTSIKDLENLLWVYLLEERPRCACSTCCAIVGVPLWSGHWRRGVPSSEVLIVQNFRVFDRNRKPRKWILHCLFQLGLTNICQPLFEMTFHR